VSAGLTDAAKARRVVIRFARQPLQVDESGFDEVPSRAGRLVAGIDTPV
jgi:hypothetical protein